jgi:hypothetical protein
MKIIVKAYLALMLVLEIVQPVPENDRIKLF